MLKKRIMALFIALCVAVISVGCTNNKSSSIDNSEDKEENNSDPFEVDFEDMFGGTVGHGLKNAKTDKNGDILPLMYNGGEMDVSYYINVSGKAKDVGLMMFVDGEPQPFRINKGKTNYMNSMKLKQDNKEEEITLSFTPVTGEKGSILNVSITSITNPDFMPDMKDTSSYGFYHQIFPMSRKIQFTTDPIKQEVDSIEALSDTSVRKEPLTQSYLEGVDNGLRSEGVEKLDNPLITKLIIDGENTELMDNLKIKKDGKLHIAFLLVGTPGAKYKTTFYLNHKALSSNGVTAFLTDLSRENIMVVEADLNLSELSEFNTFYAITTLCSDENKLPNSIYQYKSRSLLLYK